MQGNPEDHRKAGFATARDGFFAVQMPTKRYKVRFNTSKNDESQTTVNNPENAIFRFGFGKADEQDFCGECS